MKVHRVIRFIDRQIKRQRTTAQAVFKDAGYSPNLLWLWRKGKSARLSTVEDVLNAMGYVLIAVPKSEVPKDDR